MTTYKLRILPLFLLVIGLTTLTSSCKKKDMSLKLNKPHNIRGVVSYKRSFPDLNDAHQVIITSVLRTENDVKRLRRRNGNASANSAHCFGATFDVSWKRFKKVEDKDGRPMQDVSADTLKLVLSEVLRDLRQAEKCYIKYELKQGCFHITAR